MYTVYNIHVALRIIFAIAFATLFMSTKNDLFQVFPSLLGCSDETGCFSTFMHCFGDNYR